MQHVDSSWVSTWVLLYLAFHILGPSVWLLPIAYLSALCVAWRLRRSLWLLFKTYGPYERRSPVYFLISGGQFGFKLLQVVNFFQSKTQSVCSESIPILLNIQSPHLTCYPNTTYRISRQPGAWAVCTYGTTWQVWSSGMAFSSSQAAHFPFLYWSQSL